MQAATGTTKYTSSRRTGLLLAPFLVLTLLVPIVALTDQDNRSRISDQFTRGDWLALAAGSAFWLLFLIVMIAAVRANYLMLITCGPDVCRYRLPHASAWEFLRRPFALRTGEIPYAMITAVEKRREAIRWRQTCSAICLLVRDEPPRTFVRGGVGV